MGKLFDADKDNIVKRGIEKSSKSYVTEKGSWFGFSGPAIVNHWNLFKSIIGDNGLFVVAEQEKVVYDRIVTESDSISHKKRLQVFNEELFKVLKGLPTHNYNDKFVFGHLDFCVTAKTLMRDGGIVENLFWLASWSRLADSFFMDVTLCDRTDSFGFHESLLEDLIPKIFNACGWEVLSPKARELSKYPHSKNGYIYTQKYKEDGPHMRNAFYEFKKAGMYRNEYWPSED